MFVPSGIVHGHNTRQSVNGLFIPHCKLNYGSRCFAQIGNRLWNNLPNDVCQSLVFKIIFSCELHLLTLLPVL